MTDRVRNLAITLAFVFLAGIAAWGWMRKPPPAYANSGYPVTAYSPTPQAANWTAQPAGAQPVVNDAALAPCASEVDYAPPPMYASRNYVRTIRERPVTETRV